MESIHHQPRLSLMNYLGSVFYLKPRVGNCVWNREFVIPGQNYSIGVWTGGQGVVNHHAIFQLLPSWHQNANATLWRKVQKQGGSRHPLTEQQRYAYGGYPAPNYRSLSLMMNSAPWRLPAVSGYPSIIAGGWLLPAGAHIFQKYCYCSFTGYFEGIFQIFLITLPTMTKNSSFSAF